MFTIKQQDLPYCKLVVAVWHHKKVAKDVHLGMNVVCSLIPRPFAWEWNQCHVLKYGTCCIQLCIVLCTAGNGRGDGKASTHRLSLML